MSKFYDSITEPIREFIEKQQMFFVASAPLDPDGHVNLSPKGLDSFRVLSDHQVAYIDMTGSGNETSAHLRENGRLTFMFCSFTGSPNILRLYGTGRTVLPDDPEWETFAAHFTLPVGFRQIIVADIHKTQDSCGYAVPYYEFKSERQTLTQYWEAKGDEKKATYQAEKNAASIDHLPTALGIKLSQEG